VTAFDVVVHDAGGLHERVDRRRADETEAAPLELLRQRRRLRGRCGHLGQRLQPLLPGRGRGRPHELGQAARQLERRLRVSDRCLDLAAVPDDRRVAEQPQDIGLGVVRDRCQVEAGESAPESIPLAQDRDPREARLEALQRQQLEQAAVALERPAPLVVVVGPVERVVAAPAAPRDSVGVDYEVNSRCARSARCGSCRDRGRSRSASRPRGSSRAAARARCPARQVPRASPPCSRS
jgi:hypothetical protein